MLVARRIGGGAAALGSVLRDDPGTHQHHLCPSHETGRNDAPRTVLAAKGE